MSSTEKAQFNKQDSRNSTGCAKKAMEEFSSTANGPPELPNYDKTILTPDDWERLAAHFRLAARQEEVARLIFEGNTRCQIAAQLGVSPHTVRAHFRDLRVKLDVKDKTTLILRVMEVHLMLKTIQSQEQLY